MIHIRPVLIVGLALLGAIAWSLPAQAQAQCEDLEKEVAQLQRQIDALKRQVIALQAKQAGTPAPAPATAPVVAEVRPPAATPKPATPVKPVAVPVPSDADLGTSSTRPVVAGNGRAEALALYDRIDVLLAEDRVDEAKQELATFNTTYEGTPAAAWTRSLTRELTVVGKQAPADWQIERWFQGETDVDLAGETPTVVVFWESWCPHCRSEVPKLQAVYDTYRPRGLQVLGVTRLTRTATEASVEQFIAEHGVGYPIAKETGQTRRVLQREGDPGGRRGQAGQDRLARPPDAPDARAARGTDVAASYRALAFTGTDLRIRPLFRFTVQKSRSPLHRRFTNVL